MVAMRDQSGVPLAVGRFAGWEPLGFEAGDNNWYRFVANNPVLDTDPTGRFIYLSKGQAGRWDPVGVIHQDIAVDKWKKDANGCWVKDGIASFSFGVNDLNKKVDYPLQKSWLGWADALALDVLAIHFRGFRPEVELGLRAGKHMEGEIYSSTFDPKMIVSTMKTTPEEDQKWLKYMQGRLGTKDRYTVLWSNCVNYTNHEFSDAKKMFDFK